jgi:hypothetical protein
MLGHNKYIPKNWKAFLSLCVPAGPSVLCSAGFFIYCAFLPVVKNCHHCVDRLNQNLPLLLSLLASIN